MEESIDSPNVKIEKIKAWQAIAVALIAAFGGAVTTLGIGHSFGEGNNESARNYPSELKERDDKLNSQAETIRSQAAELKVKADHISELERDAVFNNENTKDLTAKLKDRDEQLNSQAEAIRSQVAESRSKADRIEELERRGAVQSDNAPAIYYSLHKSSALHGASTEDCKGSAKKALDANGAQKVQPKGDFVGGVDGPYGLLIVCFPTTDQSLVIVSGPNSDYASELRSKLRKNFDE